MKEKEQYLGLLRQLKDFDEYLSRELVAKAFQEQERKRLEVRRIKLKSSSMALGYRNGTRIRWTQKQTEFSNAFVCLATDTKKVPKIKGIYFTKINDLM